MSKDIDIKELQLFKENKYDLTPKMLNQADFVSKIIPMCYDDYFKSSKVNSLDERAKQFFGEIKMEIEADKKLTESTIKDHVNKAVSDFGKGGKGFPTGLVDKDLPILEDTAGLLSIPKPEDTNDPLAPRIEHMATKDLCASYVIWAYKTGKWNVEWKDGKVMGVSTGKFIFENVMPQLLTTAIVTNKHNKELRDVQKRIKKECTSKEYGLDVPQYYERLFKNGEHYKEVGIRFHQIEPWRLFPKEKTYEGLREPWMNELLLKKTKTKKVKKGVEAWM